MSYKDKENQRKSARKHYENNMVKMKARARLASIQNRKRNRKYVDAYLKDHPCVDCGEADVIVLEFDHIIGEKVGNISDACRQGWSIERIQAEIDKCEVRCANCHRRITHKRRNIA